MLLAEAGLATDERQELGKHHRHVSVHVAEEVDPPKDERPALCVGPADAREVGGREGDGLTHKRVRVAEHGVRRGGTASRRPPRPSLPFRFAAKKYCFPRFEPTAAAANATARSQCHPPICRRCSVLRAGVYAAGRCRQTSSLVSAVATSPRGSTRLPACPSSNITHQRSGETLLSDRRSELGSRGRWGVRLHGTSATIAATRHQLRAVRLRCVWSFQHHSAQKEWQFPSKLLKIVPIYPNA
jgi:hypothetical protein